MTVDETFGAYLARKYLEWQQDQGELRMKQEFAAHLAISPQALNNYFKDRDKPSGDRVHEMAARLGDLEIYDVLGLPRPDPLLQLLILKWKEFSEETRQAMADDAAIDVPEASKYGTPAKNRRGVGKPKRSTEDADRP